MAQAATPASVSVSHGMKAADQLSLQQLLAAAADEVHMTFPNATLMVADGSSPGAKTQDMSQVTDWRLVYNMPTTRQLRTTTVTKSATPSSAPPTAGG
ncbi:hypothetical protein [Streptomyces sp. GS7]|uniref:hypothetical protein n=1 Tax=Streptomyces sp. GS7 TaxID=2692234 RepID=UPI00191675AC|nr:hypothetical protein [Streptomyces sp. GS7]